MDPYSDVTAAMVESLKAADRVNADVLRTGWEGVSATKDAKFDVATRIADSTADLSKQIDAVDDSSMIQFTTIGRDTADLKAQVLGLTFQVRDGFTAVAKDTEISQLKTAVELAKQSVYVSDKIDGQAERTRELIHGQGERTRDLINDLKNAELNRYLIERNNELIELRHDARHWRGHAEQSQFAALSNQMQNFQSQLQEARQSTVNFGTMSGQAGRNTSTNNVA